MKRILPILVLALFGCEQTHRSPEAAAAAEKELVKEQYEATLTKSPASGLLGIDMSIPLSAPLCPIDADIEDFSPPVPCIVEAKGEPFLLILPDNRVPRFIEPNYVVIDVDDEYRINQMIAFLKTDQASTDEAQAAMIDKFGLWKDAPANRTGPYWEWEFTDYVVNLAFEGPKRIITMESKSHFEARQARSDAQFEAEKAKL